MSESRETPEALPGAGYVYQPDLWLPAAWVFDVDGTLALKTGDRAFFDWARVGEDSPNPAVVAVFSKLAIGAKIIVVSGRDAVCALETAEWIARHRLRADKLLMREERDNRPDDLVKFEIFRDKIAPNYRVLGVFDDRDKVVAMWRRIGLTCFQVAPGDF